jgi:superfamily II DNA or RNA helicase/HKD family nuclease
MRGKSRELSAGLHERLVTTEIERTLRAFADAGRPHAVEALPFDRLDEALVRHMGDALRGALRAFSDDEAGLASRMTLVNDLVARLSSVPDPEPFDALVVTREMLTWLAPTSTGLARPQPPLRPENGLTLPALLFNGRHDADLLHELRREIASAVRIDALVAFLKFHGVTLLVPDLQRFFERGGEMRLICSTYMGATDARAVDELQRLGVRIRVDLESASTRLHAKAWHFERPNGLSTAYIGSSNLSKAALTDGAEWNVRVTEAVTPFLLERFAGAFEQLWTGLTRDYEPAEHRVDLDRALAAASPTAKGGGALLGAAFVRIDTAPKPHQARALDALTAERERGHTRNLIVAATGTGKTWIAAFDYRRLRASGQADSLLFVCHRREILQQSLLVFRLVMQDPGFGELLVDGEVPTRGHHVFASIQSLNTVRLAALAPDAFTFVIVDEFHHAAAKTYTALLAHLKPRLLLGLTATPERMDGRSVLDIFEQRIAWELRLWDALAQDLLCPFHYFGVEDPTSAESAWDRGRLDRGKLDNLYDADDLRAARILGAVQRYVLDPKRMRALGFCAGVKHAEKMARAFNERGLNAVAVHADTPDASRASALRALAAGELQALFAVDLFNEGVDIPEVDTVLFLRPTESATIFLQQLGRGLRRHPTKAAVRVLDFVGHVHQEFRFEVRYQALVGGTRNEVATQIERGFPRLPPGCAIVLEPAVQTLVLDRIRSALRGRWKHLIDDLRRLGDVSLRDFLSAAGVGLDEIYLPRLKRSFGRLRLDAGVAAGSADESAAEVTFAASLGRMLHVDDPRRLGAWQAWAAAGRAPTYANADDDDRALLRMLFALLCDRRQPLETLDAALGATLAQRPLQRELSELLAVLDDAVRHTTPTADFGPGRPLRLHARYTRDEVVAAWGVVANGRLRELREGVLWDAASRTELLFVTLNKSEDAFKPSVRYQDHPLGASLFHWESQNRTSTPSTSGQRYVHHVAQGVRIILFVRVHTDDSRGEAAPYSCLGPVKYVRHEGERPMRIVWALDHEMPAELLQAGLLLVA